MRSHREVVNYVHGTKLFVFFVFISTYSYVKFPFWTSSFREVIYTNSYMWGCIAHSLANIFPVSQVNRVVTFCFVSSFIACDTSDGTASLFFSELWCSFDTLTEALSTVDIHFSDDNCYSFILCFMLFSYFSFIQKHSSQVTTNVHFQIYQIISWHRPFYLVG